MDIGFLGAGLMSAPMIVNLLADGHSVRVWNRSAAKAEALAGHGATPVATPASVCSPGGVLLSCLADDQALDAVLADGTVIEALGSGGVHASMSTISVDCARANAATHQAAGVDYLSAPILGRPDAVAARMQSWLLAGPAAARARLLPVLETLGARVFEFGDEAGAATIAKINFNFLIAASIEAMAEAFSVVEKAGLDAKVFHDMIINTAFGCRIFDGYGRMMTEQAWDDPLFRLRLGLKDVRLAQATADGVGARMRLGELLEQRYAAAVEAGLGEKDWTAIGIPVRAEAGLDEAP